MLRLRRTAHKHSRRGPCWSPCPRLRLAGSTLSGDVVPHCLRQRLPLLVFQRGEAFEKALASSPAGAKRSGRGWRIACDSTPEPATAQGAECLLRSTPRGSVRTKAIRARHAEGVASGHSFSDWRGHDHLDLPYGRANRFSGDWGYGTNTRTCCVCCKANLGPFRR